MEQAARHSSLLADGRCTVREKMEWEVVKSGGGSPPLYIVPGAGRSVTPKPIGEAVWRLVRVAGWATHRYAVADG